MYILTQANMAAMARPCCGAWTLRLRRPVPLLSGELGKIPSWEDPIPKVY